MKSRLNQQSVTMMFLTSTCLIHSLSAWLHDTNLRITDLLNTVNGGLVRYISNADVWCNVYRLQNQTENCDANTGTRTEPWTLCPTIQQHEVTWQWSEPSGITQHIFITSLCSADQFRQFSLHVEKYLWDCKYWLMMGAVWSDHCYWLLSDH